MHLTIRTGAIIGLPCALVVIAAGTADVPLSTAVRFHTACARCHEGECSGRLSFGREQDATDHIRRYVGEVPRDVQRDLYALLSDMKRLCAHGPLAVEIPKDGSWRAEVLGQLRNPAGDAYFIPLGMLPAGSHRAMLRFDGAAEVCAEVVSDAFEISHHPGIRDDGSGAAFQFSVERRSINYLRLQTGRPAELLELRVVPVP